MYHVFCWEETGVSNNRFEWPNGYIIYTYIYIYPFHFNKKPRLKKKPRTFSGSNRQTPPFFGPEASKDSNDFKEAEAEVEDSGNLVFRDESLRGNGTGGNHQSQGCGWVEKVF